MRWIRRLDREDRGATLVEYGFVLALIVLVAFGMVQLFGLDVGAIWTDIADQYPSP
jgi:pilus assembly protein Flp/PilA